MNKRSFSAPHPDLLLLRATPAEIPAADRTLGLRCSPCFIAIQPRFSTVHCLILDQLIPSVLPSPVFIQAEPRTPCPQRGPPTCLGRFATSGFPPLTSPFGLAIFQSLARCLKLATHIESLCFQSLATIKFSKHFVLITIRNGGGTYPLSFPCNPIRKFAPLFSITSTMLLPQPFSFHGFALLPGVGMPSACYG